MPNKERSPLSSRHDCCVHNGTALWRFHLPALLVYRFRNWYLTNQRVDGCKEKFSHRHGGVCGRLARMFPVLQ